MTIADIWRDAQRLQAAVDVYEGDDYPPELGAMFAAEETVLAGPILSLDDAIAKLSAVALCVERGPRADGLDILAAVDARRWLAALQQAA
jgi:hypothetical protein